jgi:hypothetical protein
LGYSTSHRYLKPDGYIYIYIYTLYIYIYIYSFLYLYIYIYGWPDKSQVGVKAQTGVAKQKRDAQVMEEESPAGPPLLGPMPKKIREGLEKACSRHFFLLRVHLRGRFREAAATQSSRSTELSSKSI